MEILNVSLDKMTIVGNLNSELAYALQNAVNEPHVQIKGLPTTGFIEGQFFFYGYAESVYYCYDEVNSNAMSKRNFRMEFNPSKITPTQSKWLKDKIIYILDDIGITRLDIAFDCDFDLSKLDYEFKNTLERERIGRDGTVQTLYYGARTSDFYYRIYNKKLEQEKEIKKKLRAIEKRKLQKLAIEEYDLKNNVEPLLYDTEHWWRYEVEIKNADTIDKMIDFEFPLFLDKRIIIYDINTLEGIDAVMVTGLLTNPKLMADLHPNTRTKYRKIIKNLGGHDVTPLFNNALDKKKPELIGQINSWRKINYSVL